MENVMAWAHLNRVIIPLFTKENGIWEGDTEKYIFYKSSSKMYISLDNDSIKFKIRVK